VTGDLAGFLAASWHRGVPLVQVPTTLLAMVDAAIGGKTAVNLRGGKNLVGAVHQPLAVYADTAALDTLPQARLRDGFAEVVKAGVIADAGLFRWLEPRAARLLERRPRLLTEAIDRSVQVKASVVRRDEREAGRRAMLNFGHTVAHALEAASGYRVSHGRAVAIGMVVEAHLAVAATGFPVAELERLERLLAAFGLPTRVPPGLAPERLARAARRDKKARRGRTRYALPLRLGRMPAGSDPTREISDTDLLEALRGLQTGPRRPKLTSL
jgi:3-dehydroquinate synthase